MIPYYIIAEGKVQRIRGCPSLLVRCFGGAYLSDHRRSPIRSASGACPEGLVWCRERVTVGLVMQPQQAGPARLASGHGVPLGRRSDGAAEPLRGGAFDSVILGCAAVAVLPEDMSRERFAWLTDIGAEVIATPGSESNVKEIYDKCAELDQDPDTVIFNQFSEFGNHIGHYTLTGRAIEHVFESMLAADPSLIPTAVEEFLRAYSPVTMARVVSEETQFKGCPMHVGDKVLMNFPAANRDPDVFENPDVVDIDRQRNRHIAFGVGIHRCAGSNLARMEMVVALEAFLSRIPEFRLEDPSAVTWAGGQVRGHRRLPLVF